MTSQTFSKEPGTVEYRERAKDKEKERGIKHSPIMHNPFHYFIQGLIISRLIHGHGLKRKAQNPTSSSNKKQRTEAHTNIS